MNNQIIKKYFSLIFGLAIIATLTSCMGKNENIQPVEIDSQWQYSEISQLETVDDKLKLENWWQKIDDDNLNKLVELALADSPDLKIALYRIEEARGVRRSNRSFLFPQIGWFVLV